MLVYMILALNIQTKSDHLIMNNEIKHNSKERHVFVSYHGFQFALHMQFHMQSKQKEI